MAHLQSKGSVAVAFMFLLLMVFCIIAPVSLGLALATLKLAAQYEVRLKYDCLELFAGWFVPLYFIPVIIWVRRRFHDKAKIY